MDGILDSLSHDFCGESSCHIDIYRNIANAGSIDGIAVSHSCYRIDASGIGTAGFEHCAVGTGTDPIDGNHDRERHLGGEELRNGHGRAEIADRACPWLEHTAQLLAAFDRAGNDKASSPQTNAP